MTAAARPAVTYESILRSARTRGFAAGRAELQRIDQSIRLAIRQLTVIADRGGSARLASERAFALRRELDRALAALQTRLSATGQQTVNATVSDVIRLHRDGTTAMAGAVSRALPTTFGARFDALPSKVLTVLAARRGGAAVSYRTLIRRNMEDAAPALDTLLEAGIARGATIESLTLSVADLLRGSQPADPALRVSGLAGLGTIRSDARRIARSETMNALREANSFGMVASGVVQAVQWQVNGAHPLEDECDILATVDLYGFGGGYWPPDQFPLAPHPNCGCYQGAVKIRPPGEWGKPLELSGLPGSWAAAVPDDWSPAKQQAARTALGRAVGTKPTLVTRGLAADAASMFDQIEKAAVVAAPAFDAQGAFAGRLNDDARDFGKRLLRGVGSYNFDRREALALAHRETVSEMLVREGYTDEQITQMREVANNITNGWASSSSSNGGAWLKFVAETDDNPILYHGRFIDHDPAKAEGVRDMATDFMRAQISQKGDVLTVDDMLRYHQVDREVTQAALRELSGGRDTITLYRGVTRSTFTKAGQEVPLPGERGRMAHNAVASWSVVSGVAEEFGDVVLKVNVPIKQARMAFVTNKALLWEEMEVIVDGLPMDYEVVSTGFGP